MNTNAQHYFNHGLIAELEERFVEAISFYSEAINLDPTLIKAYINRGNIYFQTGQTFKGKQDLKQASKIDPVMALYYYPA